jgi:hypothetical protein
MTASVSKLSIAGLAIVGLGATSASAQAVYVDPYVQPYPVVVAPASPYIAPPPIVRQRTVVVGGRPAYTAAPTYRFGAPIAPYGYAGYNYPRYDYPGYGYSGYSYASDVLDPDW